MRLCVHQTQSDCMMRNKQKQFKPNIVYKCIYLEWNNFVFIIIIIILIHFHLEIVYIDIQTRMKRIWMKWEIIIPMVHSITLALIPVKFFAINAHFNEIFSLKLIQLFDESILL